MKGLLFTLLIIAGGAHALPKNPWINVLAATGISGLAFYFSNLMNPSYAMKKEQMFSKRIDVPKSIRPVNFAGYHIAVNETNDIYDYKFSLADVNLSNAAQEIGYAYVICTRESARHPHGCDLAQLHVHKNYRYSGFGSLILQETIADLKQRTTANELDFVACAEHGTSQERLEHFYEKNGAKRKANLQSKKAFVFNLRDNKV